MEPQGILFERVNFPESDALFSSCRQYRYKLTRTWDSRLSTVNFIMLNPSTADESVNDPTIARQIERSKRWGMGGIVITNLFAWRSTDPSVLPSIKDPVGPDNDYEIGCAAALADLIVCGWGTNGGLRGRDKAVLELLKGFPLTALKITKEGHPQHPLYIGYDAVTEPFNAA